MHSFMSYPEIQHFFKDFTKTSDANVLVFRHRQEIRLETVRAVKTSTTLLPATAVMHEGTAPPAGGPAVLH